MEVYTKDEKLTFKEKAFSLLKERKRVFLVGSGLVFLLLLAVLSQGQMIKKSSLESSSPTSKLSQDLAPKGQAPVANPPPEVSFGAYRLETDLPKVPEKINLYAFKTNYSDQEVKDFAAKFGLLEIRPTGEDHFIASNLEDINNRGYLLFNKKSGGFSFQSYGIHQPLSSPSNNPAAIAESFLKEKGLLDETVFAQATYQRSTFPDVTFVEFHRNWEKAGLPILNIVGLLNLDERTKLADLKLGMADQRMPDNETIINTSDNYDGKARPNDFNTLTVAVANDGRILSLESNLRPIEKVQALTSQDTTFLTPQQAFAQIQKGKGIFKLTLPSGEGIVDFNKVYPGNLAQAKQATVTDLVLAYLEKPPAVTQSFLQPVYIFKGFAELSSGYRVNWVQAIPVIANTQISLPEVLGEKTIQLGSFTPAPTSATPTELQPTPTNSSTLPSAPREGGGTKQECDPGMFEVIAEIPGIGKIGMWGIKQTVGGISIGTFRTFGYIYDNPGSAKPIDEVRRAFFVENPGLVAKQWAILVARHIQSSPPNLLDMFGGNNPSVQDIYNLFDFMDEFYGSTASPNLGSNIKAPLSPRALQLHASMVDDYFIYWMGQVAESTARILIPAIKNGTIAELANKKDLFLPETTKQGFLHALFFNYENMMGGTFWTPGPQCRYLTGVSPSLYFYPSRPTKITINLDTALTYTDPPANNNSWRFTAHPDGTLKGSFGERARLYYEYSPIEFADPKEGFVVKRGEWEDFIREKIALKLGLTEKETDDLVTDVRNALIDVKTSPYLKISFVDRKELDEKLPVVIDPEPDVFARIHLLLSPYENPVNIPAPTIQSVFREGFTALELGARIR